MKKRDKKLWRKWTPCKKCGGRKTWGGIKVLFGLIKIKKWERDFCKCEGTCKCETSDKNEVTYNGFPTELDKQKCEEVLKEQKENENNDNKTTD